jgi:tRNA pseudouridine55 synthase
MSSPVEPGAVLIDKSVGKTSFSVVRSIRRIFGAKKVGHAGTLDPFASGLLVVCIGRPATKLIDSLMSGEKTYQARLLLGKVSTTQDPEGEIRPGGSVESVSEEKVEAALARFRGTIMQTPPSFSALKHKGKPLYHYARKGITITKAPRRVTVHDLSMSGSGLTMHNEEGSLELLVTCSKGTYIRSLAEDIGRELGCGAYLSALRRTHSGGFCVSDAVPGNVLDIPEKAGWIRDQRIGLEELYNILQLS